MTLPARYSATETLPATRPDLPRGLMLLGSLPAEQLANRSITTEQRDEAKALVLELDRWLDPAPRGRVLARILTLLEHFWSNKREPAVEKAIAEDWADALREHPFWSIELACKHWRDTEKRAPKIAEIIELSNAERQRYVQARDGLRKVAGMAAEAPFTDKDRTMSPETRRLIDECKASLTRQKIGA